MTTKISYLCIMKRALQQVLVFFIAIIFLVFNGGVFFYVHECHSMHSSEISFFTKESNCCAEELAAVPVEPQETLPACCAHEKPQPKPKPAPHKKPCCSDKHVYIKLANDFFGSSNSTVTLADSQPVTWVCVNAESHSSVSGTRYLFFFGNGPPGTIEVRDIFSRNCQFLI
jgi:hypothetical protein